MQLRDIQRDAVGARERLDPLGAEMVADVVGDGLKIDVTVAAAGVAAIDEAEMAGGVDEEIVERGVAMNEDDVLFDPRRVCGELLVDLKRRAA